jgi:hypothetical protein
MSSKKLIKIFCFINNFLFVIASSDGSLIVWDYFHGSMITKVFHPDYEINTSPVVTGITCNDQDIFVSYIDNSIVRFDFKTIKFV